jgi:hypothetical protein
MSKIVLSDNLPFWKHQNGKAKAKKAIFEITAM